MANAKEVAEKLRALNIEDIVDKAMRFGVNQGTTDIVDRIFEKSEDTKGGTLGKYSKSYAKIREKKGKQTAVVDLQFDKDLIRSVKEAFGENKYVIEIKEPLNVAKARGYEKRKGLDVFSGSDKEVERIIELINEQFKIGVESAI